MTLWKGRSGGAVPHCLWDEVNDDLLFSGKTVPDWPQRSLSLRQACRGATSWTRDQILGRSVEHATKPFKHFTPFQYVYKHLIYSLPPPSIRASYFCTSPNMLTGRNHNYQDLGHFINIPQYALISTTVLGSPKPS